MLDKMTGRSRGFGFVTFDNEEELKEAVRQMHDSDLDGRKISCTRAIPQSQTAPGTPASALAGGSGPPRGSSRYGGGPDRYRERAYDRAPERPPPRGYAGRAYDDRRYDRGSYGGSYRQPDRGYDRGAYPPAEYDRGYDRGYPPPSYRWVKQIKRLSASLSLLWICIITPESFASVNSVAAMIVRAMEVAMGGSLLDMAGECNLLSQLIIKQTCTDFAIL